MLSRFLALLLVSGALPVAAQPASLLPVPTSVRTGTGRFSIDSTTSIAITGHSDPRLERAISRLLHRLSRRIAQPMSRSITRTATPRSIAIDVAGPGMPVQGIDENERYTLTVSADGATLQAATTVGALRGLETLLQLVVGDGTSFSLDAVSIADEPRFAWRGLLVDVSRHFMPIEQLKRTLDGMALVKLNVFHWHLSDDQGFRVESKHFPKLHELGSDGLYYTQQEVRDLVAYARDRGIRVVPEFDMPGHSTSWFVGYPQYSAQRPPIAIRREWGGADAIFDPTKETTYTFIARFLDEMIPLFPDAYWHIGGDEVEGKHWDSNPEIVAWRTRHGFRDNHALQLHFTRRLTTLLSRHGKRMVGWDEILHPDLPPRTVVQSWRGRSTWPTAPSRASPGSSRRRGTSTTSSRRPSTTPPTLSPSSTNSRRRSSASSSAARPASGPSSSPPKRPTRASGRAWGPWPSGSGRRAP
ncbi:MAG: family 20 glycosylhydrolase [Gemmatimonadetes bacterium]|nr:family 20 glycosylhydrolase [Gemmatimonadota bacterium]